MPIPANLDEKMYFSNKSLKNESKNIKISVCKCQVEESCWWPRGLMDMASDFESEDCGFESHRGQRFFLIRKNYPASKLSFFGYPKHGEGTLFRGNISMS